jgi:hypothetical protein
VVVPPAASAGAEIKIDASFVTNLAVASDDAIIVR